MEENYYLYKEEKVFGRRKKVRARKTVYYLQEYRYGQRVEVKRSYNNVVEVSLLVGGGTSQVKQFIAKNAVLSNPTKEQLDEQVKDYCINAAKFVYEEMNKSSDGFI